MSLLNIALSDRFAREENRSLFPLLGLLFIKLRKAIFRGIQNTYIKSFPFKNIMNAHKYKYTQIHCNEADEYKEIECDNPKELIESNISDLTQLDDLKLSSRD